MSKNVIDCRAAAARCLLTVSNGSSLSQQILIFEDQVKERDQALYRQLCYGAIRLYPKLEAIAKQLLAKPMKEKDRDIFMLILLGIYQLSELRIPDHAAVNATVAASRTFKKTWAKGLINGVLRNWQRQSESILQKLSDAEMAAHPQWLHKQLKQSWPKHFQLIEAANNEHPPFCIRINPHHHTRQQYLQLLTEHELNASACEFAEEGIRLEQATSVDKLPGFEQGWASVQDEAPQLSAKLLDLKAGQRVLDACCAPGGKTGHLLETEPKLEELIALDIDEHRLERVQQNLDRLQLTATLLQGDAASPESWWDGKHFDRILLDAPCSATGVIRRNPDIKLHRTAADITQLSQLQLSILQALWPTLKQGGLLLYATCSVLPTENEQVIQQFCQHQEGAEHVPINASWGITRDYGRQLFPQLEGHDGFYYALLKKVHY